MKWGWVWVLVGLVVGVPEAWGQQPPETHPASSNQDIVMSWDRSALPGDVELWATRTLLAYQNTRPFVYETAHLVCSSSTDAAEGRCPTVGLVDSSSGEAEVWVRATEERTGMTADLRVVGAQLRPLSGPSCGSSHWANSRRPLWNARLELCGRDQSAGLGAELRLPADQLERLVAGKWRANLRLNMIGVPGGSVLASHSFSFNFTITDHNAVSIYFPQYESATPLVNLDARFDPIHQTVGGRVVVAMCLYDGLGSQASHLGVTARHTSARAPGPTGFALWHEAPGNADSQRLDYTVTLKHSDADVPLANGVETQLRGIDSARLQLVLLPGMSQPVFCVPTPMTLEMPLVPVSEKQSGVYWGDLKIELRVPTASP